MSSLIQKAKKAIKLAVNSDERFLFFYQYGKYNNMSDEDYLKKLFKLRMGYELNLDDPKTFCEKIQWLKLFDQKPEYIKMVDKLQAKEWVTEKIGSEHVVPLLGVWNNYQDIDFSLLPKSFVLKCTHDSGGVIICRNKYEFNPEIYKSKFEKWLSTNAFWSGREWVYKNIKPRIIAERYVDGLGNRNSIEYKVTCCDGKVKMITICTGIAHSSFDARNNDHYDRDWNYLPFYAYYKNTHKIEKPPFIDKIIEYCEILSAGIPQVRVDGYINDGEWYFGEMTFYTWNGFIEFTPREWDSIMGEWIRIPTEKIVET